MYHKKSLWIGELMWTCPIVRKHLKKFLNTISKNLLNCAKRRKKSINSLVKIKEKTVENENDFSFTLCVSLVHVCIITGMKRETIQGEVQVMTVFWIVKGKERSGRKERSERGIGNE